MDGMTEQQQGSGDQQLAGSDHAGEDHAAATATAMEQ
jgi:hypothetical protein